MQYIQKAIWEYTQTILEENHFEKSDDHVFYSQMVDKIFETFLEIEESSQEIEKIINIYLRFAYQKNESKEEIIYNNLAINTFNYMIETDETLKVIPTTLRTCCISAIRRSAPPGPSRGRSWRSSSPSSIATTTTTRRTTMRTRPTARRTTCNRPATARTTRCTRRRRSAGEGSRRTTSAPSRTCS